MFGMWQGVCSPKFVEKYKILVRQAFGSGRVGLLCFINCVGWVGLCYRLHGLGWVGLCYRLHGLGWVGLDNFNPWPTLGYPGDTGQTPKPIVFSFMHSL